MAEVGQYNFTSREVGIALLRDAKITTGKWSFGVNIGVNIGNFGPDEAQAIPTVMAQIQGITMQKVPDEAQDVGLVIDASKI